MSALEGSLAVGKNLALGGAGVRSRLRVGAGVWARWSGGGTWSVGFLVAVHGAGGEVVRSL